MSHGHSAAATGGHVVIAELEVKPEQIGDFITLARSFAAECVAREPGCRQFDVAEGPVDPKSFFLYEVYDDEAAFKAHQEYPHFHEYRERAKDWIASRKILTYRRISAAPLVH